MSNFSRMHDEYLTPPEEDEMLNNQHIAEAFPDYTGPYDLYRKVYKYGIGHTIGFYIYGAWGNNESDEGTKSFYCDDLNQFGTWQDMDKKGYLITDISVGSIVEGADVDAQTIIVEWKQLDFEPDELAKQFWQACDDVAAEVDELWHEWNDEGWT